ncbi:CSLREA domain-containing protein [Candidatus Gracilibacteria bacterium]|nr:CSLREA domain-containing protein [Candidatus Gracilibacteria bacterium]
MARRTQWLRLLSVFLLAAGAILLVPGAVRAAGAYTVTSTADTGGNCNTTPTNCTLRQAINSANVDGVASTITFQFTTSGNVIIAPDQPLPSISSPNTTITGLLSNVTFQPRVRIDGGGDLSVGFRISSSSNRIEKLIFTGFRGASPVPGGAAIYITGTNATANTVVGNYIGNIPFTTYSPDFANNFGVVIDGRAENNTIGGVNDTDRNVISGNNFDGIQITNSDGNTIFNNFIGIAADLNTLTIAPLGNGVNGVQVSDGALNVIGGIKPNIVSGNDVGILITGSAAVSNTIGFNYIGSTDTGIADTVDFSNSADGVRVSLGARGTELIGTAQQPLIIAGNGGHGVRVTGDETADTTISGALIGVQIDGTSPLSNTLDGIRIENNAERTTIGPGNTISSNGGYGVSVGITSNSFTAVRDVTIADNTIGLTASYTGSLQNAAGGISIEAPDFAVIENILIGGSEADGNVIGGNGGPGIVISGTNTFSTTIAGNLIGVAQNTAGKFLAPAGNNGPGVLVQSGVISTTIGGNLGANTIVANNGPGVQIRGSETATATVALNFIGLALDGANEVDLGNEGPAVSLDTIFNSSVLTNTIAFNTTGISLTEVLTATVAGNAVRTNSDAGLLVTGGRYLSLANNVLDENGGNGVVLTNVVTATLNGGDVLNNGGDGVLIDGASRQITVSNNLLRANGGYGVRVDLDGQRIEIIDNRMAANALGGIELVGTTVGSGDAANPNRDIDPPVIDLSSPLRPRLNQNGDLVGYVITSTNLLESAISPVSACVTCTVQIFAPDAELPAPDGQGFTKIGGDVSVDAEGRFSANIPRPFPPQLLFTATDGFGNTSEFAVFSITTGLRITPLDPVPAVGSAFPTQSISYTFTVENSGSLDLTDLQFTVDEDYPATLDSWERVLQPATEVNANSLSLPAAFSTTVTVTLTLPPSPNDDVLVGKQDVTRVLIGSQIFSDVVASALMTTTVLPKTVISVSPLTASGSGRPGTTVTHEHVVTNLGNITATVMLTFTTTPADLWETTISTTTLEIGPGDAREFVVDVSVPQGAQDKNPDGSPVSAVTIVEIDVLGAPDQNKVVTDTTFVTLVQRAVLFGGENREAGAGQVVRILHTAENTSNGTATFKINASSDQGSTITFESATDGVQLVNGDTFTISNRNNPPNERNTFDFFVVVTIAPDAELDSLDTIVVFLTETNGNSIGGATVRSRITITSGTTRLYLPVVRNGRGDV